MDTQISEKIAASRGKIGTLVLIGSSIAIALFHAKVVTSPVGIAHGLPVNLPIPLTQGALPQVEPENLSSALAQAAFHPSDSCNIASVNGGNYDRDVSITQGTIIGLGGWIVDRVNGGMPQSTWIILAGKESGLSYQAPVTFWMNRPDVREALGGNPSYTRAGFMSNIKTDQVAPGKYHLYVKYEASATFYTCDNGRYITIDSNNS